MIKPGDLVKHADWNESPINSYREGIGLVVRYDRTYTSGHGVQEEVLKNWVVVEWLPYNPSACKTVYHVDSLKRCEECK